VILGVGSKAVTAAGFTTKKPKFYACQILKRPRIRLRIKELRGKLRKRAMVEATEVIREYARVGFANIQDYLDTGNMVKDLTTLPADVAAAVESIHFDVRHDGGGSKGYTEKVRLKLHDKIKALDSLARHLGLFEKDNGQKNMTVADMMAMAEGVRARR
jgi:phage terminase small subunit